MNKKITSPCIGVCCMSEETGYCNGCLRTIEEISNWINYAEEERLSILEGLEKRRENLTALPSHNPPKGI